MAERLIFIMVVVSGFSGLVYQVIWQKYLATILGSHASATAFILAGFFAFLGLGYSIIGRLVARKSWHRIRIYALLELVIGMYAILSPDYFVWLREFSLRWLLHTTSIPGLGETLATTMTVGLPVFLMGGTIPVLTEGLTHAFGDGHKVHARVYGLNTIGAFLGALISGFYLIEAYGLPLTLYLAGVLNVLVFFVAIGASASIASLETSPRNLFRSSEASSLAIKMSPGSERFLLFIVSLISGFYVFGFEALIIRVAGFSLGSSVYTYALVVSCFIATIAFGSLLAGRFDSSERPIYLVWMQAGLALAAVGLYILVPHWPNLFFRVRSLFLPIAMNFDFFWFAVLIVMLLILVAPVGLMGMNIPFLFGYLRRREDQISSLVGQLYAYNSIGSVLGAVIAGYFMLQWFSTAQIFKFLIGLVILNGLLLTWLARHSLGKLNFSFKSLGWMILCSLLFFDLKPWSPLGFLPARGYLGLPTNFHGDINAFFRKIFQDQPKILFDKDDPNTWVTVTETPLQSTDKMYPDLTAVTALNVNGKPDAVYPGDASARLMLPLVGMSLAPRLDRVFIVGLGAGLSTAVVSGNTDTGRVTVGEISSGVVEALPYFANFNQGLDLNKVELKIGDAYQTLRLSPERYDLILCEPSNPWVLGVDKLFTLEFLKAVSERLSEDGVFGQWFPLGSLDPKIVTLIFRTFREVFPEVRIWNVGGGTVTIVAAKKSIHLNRHRIAQVFEQNSDHFKRLGLKQPESILGLEILPTWTVSAMATKSQEIHTVEYPTLIYRAGRGLFVRAEFAFDAQINQFLRKIPPLHEPSAQFLRAQLSDWPTPEIVNDLVGFYSFSGSALSRAWSTFWLFKSKEADFVSPPASFEKMGGSDWTAVLLKKRSLPEFKEEDRVKVLSYLVTAYRRLKVVHAPASLSILKSVLPSQCDDQACAYGVLDALQEWLPANHPIFNSRLDLKLAQDRAKVIAAIPRD